MKEHEMAEMLASRLEGGSSAAFADERGRLSDRERQELASLVQLAGCLDARMQLRQAPPAFARSLGRELVREAERRIAKRRRRRRTALIGGAVAGTVVSIASLVGGIVVLVKWLRTRTEARQASTA